MVKQCIRTAGMMLFIFILNACSLGEPDQVGQEPAEKPTETREWVVKWNGEPDPVFSGNGRCVAQE